MRQKAGTENLQEETRLSAEERVQAAALVAERSAAVHPAQDGTIPAQ